MIRTRFVAAMAFLMIGFVPGAMATGLACHELTVFVRAGCPHCEDAKAFLAELQGRHPQLRIEYEDVSMPASAERMARIVDQRHIRRPGVPLFVMCGEVSVGFGRAATTGRMIEDLLTGRIDSLAHDVAVPLPGLGQVSPGELGLPVFTVVLGLIDGFNPCAMWVLLFLLSLLVHVRSRWRIAAIAGTFVLVSGIVYFAFMAAWLNVFLFLGYSRLLQVLLGCLAITVGAVHVKDFFALHRGLSLSIPEAAKPTLYERVRRVVRAENFPAAMLGIVTLAVLVNFIELLCTAGLPALFTQVLTYYPLSDAGYYGYLLLYNLAYIFDDGIMVTIAVATLGQRRLQEKEGRWLKLLSGGLIFALGLVMLLAPDALLF
ncbi:MAG: hypothetical protein R3200_06040 [Xanthomonadales bacterium]|nr:hypothetical protein [Xanthomonadales bacterium]